MDKGVSIKRNTNRRHHVSDWSSFFGKQYLSRCKHVNQVPFVYPK